MKKQPAQETRALRPTPAPLATDALVKVVGGGDIQARAFGAGKYGIDG